MTLKPLKPPRPLRPFRGFFTRPFSPQTTSRTVAWQIGRGPTQGIIKGGSAIVIGNKVTKDERAEAIDGFVEDIRYGGRKDLRSCRRLRLTVGGEAPLMSVRACSFFSRAHLDRRSCSPHRKSCLRAFAFPIERKL